MALCGRRSGGTVLVEHPSYLWNTTPALTQSIDCSSERNNRETIVVSYSRSVCIRRLPLRWRIRSCRMSLHIKHPHLVLNYETPWLVFAICFWISGVCRSCDLAHSCTWAAQNKLARFEFPVCSDMSRVCRLCNPAHDRRIRACIMCLRTRHLQLAQLSVSQTYHWCWRSTGAII